MTVEGPESQEPTPQIALREEYNGGKVSVVCPVLETQRFGNTYEEAAQKIITDAETIARNILKNEESSDDSVEAAQKILDSPDPKKLFFLMGSSRREKA